MRAHRYYLSGINLFGYAWIVECKTLAAAERAALREIRALWFLFTLTETMLLAERWERSRLALRVTRYCPSIRSVRAR